MADAVFPAGGRALEVGEVVHDPSVNVFDWEGLSGAVLDGHEYQTGKRVRRFQICVHLLTRVTI